MIWSFWDRTRRLPALDFDPELSGFDPHEIDDFLSDADVDDRAGAAPPAPDQPGFQAG